MAARAILTSPGSSSDFPLPQQIDDRGTGPDMQENSIKLGAVAEIGRDLVDMRAQLGEYGSRLRRGLGDLRATRTKPRSGVQAILKPLTPAASNPP